MWNWIELPSRQHSALWGVEGMLWESVPQCSEPLLQACAAHGGLHNVLMGDRFTTFHWDNGHDDLLFERHNHADSSKRATLATGLSCLVAHNLQKIA